MFASAEGMFGMGRAVLKGPCPESLDAAQCGLYGAALASKALPLLQRAEQLRAVAAEADGWSRKEQRGLAKLAESVAAALAAAKERGAVPEPPKPDGPWVAVRYGAWFHGGGTKARETGWEHPEFRPPNRMLLVSDQLPESGRVRVASVGYERGHCLERGPVGQAWRLELEVDVRDLVFVTTTRLKARFDDGTGYDLPPGVALDAENRPISRDVVVPVVVAEDTRTLVWRARGIHVEDDGTADWMPVEIPLTVGGKPTPVHDDGPEVPLDAVETKDGRTLVTFETVCGRVTAELGGELPPPETGSGGLGGIFGSMSQSGRVRVAPGDVWWPDGSRAGKLTETRSFLVDEVESKDGTSCGDVRLGYLHYPDGVPEDGALRVCVPDERVTPAEPSPGLEDLLKKSDQ